MVVQTIPIYRMERTAGSVNVHGVVFTSQREAGILNIRAAIILYRAIWIGVYSSVILRMMIVAADHSRTEVIAQITPGMEIFWPPTPRIMYTPMLDKRILPILGRVTFSLRKMTAKIDMLTGFIALMREDKEASRSLVPKSWNTRERK